jgi:hypothetical protein
VRSLRGSLPIGCMNWLAGTISLLPTRDQGRFPSRGSPISDECHVHQPTQMSISRLASEDWKGVGRHSTTADRRIMAASLFGGTNVSD